MPHMTNGVQFFFRGMDKMDITGVALSCVIGWGLYCCLKSPLFSYQKLQFLILFLN